jgi:hypothetical protein
MAKFKKINSVEELKKECEDNYDFFISFGVSRSSKGITYNEEDDTFTVHHEIDDTFEDINSEDIEKTNIGKAMREEKFYVY